MSKEMFHRMFHGKHLGKDEWAEGYYYQDSMGRVYLMSSPRENGFADAIRVDPVTVGQDTGMVDKAGRRAFELDVLRDTWGETVGVIRYGKYQNPFSDTFSSHVGFYVDWVSGRDKEYLRKDLGYWLAQVEIVGSASDVLIAIE